MDSIEHGAANVVGEAFDELIGRSKRSWALTLVAFVLGAVATAVVVIKVAQRRAADSAGGTRHGRHCDAIRNAAVRGAFQLRVDSSARAGCAHRRDDASARGQVREPLECSPPCGGGPTRLMTR